MNKNAIKVYAIWARRELINRVSQKAFEYGIEKEQIEDVKGDTVKGVVLSQREKSSRLKLISEIKAKGFDQVMEEVAYTWFNRFIALRFMEVNNYLPQRVRPFTDEENKFNPQIIDEASDLDFVDQNEVYSYKINNDTDGLYKYLLIALCNDMNQYLPGMFETIDDYKVLLFPDNLLREGSVVSRLISDIDEDSWADQVQIIGWLYQFYNTEPKDKVYARKSGTKIKKEDIPAVTQLFTPDWIVRYMAENSLGRLWLDGHPNADIKSNWKYYLDEAEQEPDVQKELDKIKEEHAKLTPEIIAFLDPCMGSGHILVYAFDVFMQIYVSEGWTEREASVSILKNNIFGLDIDERAYQLSYFALMMKARQYNRRILSENITPNVMAIEESNTFKRHLLNKFGKDLQPLATRLIDTFIDAKEYGSILNVEFTKEELDSLQNKLNEIYVMSSYGDLLSQSESDELVYQFTPLLNQARIMSQKYDCVVTNPPYNPVSNCENKLQEYVKKNYPDSKTDFFAIFMEKALTLIKKNSYYGMINMHSWMFLSSYETLRSKTLHNSTIVTMAHLGARAFEEINGEIVQTTAFIIKKKYIKNYNAKFKRLITPNTQDGKERMFLEGINEYNFLLKNCTKIPGMPIAYWASNQFIEAFVNGIEVREIADIPKGLSTGSVDKYMRAWFEVVHNKIDFMSGSCEESKQRKHKWFPYAKGGSFRRWYGNLEYIVNWENDGFEVKHFVDDNGKQRSRPQNTQFYFKKCLTYSAISSYKFSLRYLDRAIFGGGGDSIHTENKHFTYLFGLLNSKVAQHYLSIISPTMNFEVDHIKRVPLLFNDNKVECISQLTLENQNQSKYDWDSYETSWDFIKHPLVRGLSTLKASYDAWNKECSDRFNQLKSNEEELNRIFIDIYGLQGELTPEVEDKDVTVRKADLTRDIKSLISYAVGCMFGRYSLDTEGLAYAGGEWDNSKYKTYIPDSDNILPITDDEYFEDDIVSRFINFIRITYGEDTLEENLKFISDVLGGKGSPREVIRNYFLNDFFKDHCSIYQKRPIYWQFDSGKKNGFKALIYMHRYTPDLLAKMRTDYVHEQQERYRTQIENLETEIINMNGPEKIKVNKQLAKYKDQLAEISVFEEKLHHLADQMISIDLDDGFKQNYPKFEGIVTKVK